MKKTSIRQISILPSTTGAGFDLFHTGADHPKIEFSQEYATKEAVLAAVADMLDRVKFEVPA